MFRFEPSVQDGNLQRRRAQLARLDPPAVYKRAVSQSFTHLTMRVQIVSFYNCSLAVDYAYVICQHCWHECR